MLDVIARLLISLGIVVGTTQWPSSSAQTPKTDRLVKSDRLCPAKRDTVAHTCMA